LIESYFIKGLVSAKASGMKPPAFNFLAMKYINLGYILSTKVEIKKNVAYSFWLPPKQSHYITRQKSSNYQKKPQFWGFFCASFCCTLFV
jgi:hypothetical protein